MTSLDTRRHPASAADHDRFHHYVDTVLFPGDRVGRWTKALCGKVWRPEGNGDGGFPVCPTCEDVARGRP